MATNKSMIEALERTAELISNINKQVKELNAWNTVLKSHITAQKKQHGHDWNDHYSYDEKTSKCERVYGE